MTYSVALAVAAANPENATSLYLADGTFCVLVQRQQLVASTTYYPVDLYAVDANRTAATLVVSDVLDVVTQLMTQADAYTGICRDSADGIYVVSNRSYDNGAPCSVRYLTKGAGLTWTKNTILTFTTTGFGTHSPVWCNTGGGLGGAGHLLDKQDGSGYVLNAGIVKQGSGSPLVNSYSSAFPSSVASSKSACLLPNDAPGAVGGVEGWWAHTSSIAGGQVGSWSVTSAGVLTATNFGNVGAGGDSVRLLRISSINAVLVHRSTTTAKVGVSSLSKTAIVGFANSIPPDGITGWVSPTADQGERRWDAAYDRAFNKVWLYAPGSPDTAVMRVGGTVNGTTSITWDTVAVTEASGLPASSFLRGPPTAPPGSRWDWLRAGIALTGGSTLFNQAPFAPTLTGPANGSTLDLAAPQRLAFTFSDPDVGDSLTKFDIRWSSNGGSTWNTVTRITPNAYWDADPNTFPAGTITWNARTYDAIGTPGPYSGDSTFTAGSTPGGLTITAPPNGSTVATPTATVTWSAPAQTNYQIRKVADLAGVADTATIYYDSGDVLDGSTRAVAMSFPTSARWVHIQVRVKSAGLWSSWADSRVWVNYDPPMVPTIILTPVSTTASITVAITNPTPVGAAPVVAYNDVFVSSPLDPEYRAATQVPPNSVWTWRRPGAGRVYRIRAVAVGTTGTTATSGSLYSNTYSDIY